MSRRLKDFFYYAREGKWFYGTLLALVASGALCVVTYMAGLYISGVWLWLMILCGLLLYGSRVPDPLYFAWLRLLRVLCWLFGCRLINGWGGGGMFIQDAECTRCRTMCKNIYRPLYERPYWKRKETR